MKLTSFNFYGGHLEHKKTRNARAELLVCQSKPIAFLTCSLPSPSSLLLVSLRNRTAGRRGRQNVFVWQTWQGYNLHVVSWSSLSINVFWFLQKDLSKGKWWLAKSYFKQICCHGCHTRFAVFFPLPSCCVSSLLTRFPQISQIQSERRGRIYLPQWIYFVLLKVMLHETIRNDECWNNIATIRDNIATMLSCCVALKIVVANRLVKHHLKGQFTRRWGDSR